MYTATPGLSHNHEDPLLITSRLEIAGLLRTLMDENALINVRAHKDSPTVITTLLDIDDRQDVFVISAALEQDFNESAVDAEAIEFEVVQDKTQIKFTCAFATPCQHDCSPALRLAMPTSLRRIQRREFYRVGIPVNQPARCTMALPARMAFSATSSKRPTVTLDLKDISVGGISLIDNDKKLNVASDTLYPDCYIVLPEAGAITTTLRVVRAFDETVSSVDTVRFVGCAFVNLPSSMTTTVQRYVALLERKLNARRFGFD